MAELELMEVAQYLRFLEVHGGPLVHRLCRLWQIVRVGETPARQAVLYEWIVRQALEA